MTKGSCEVHYAPILAAVLAGGKSTRMGQDKNALQLNGKTLLDRAIEILHLSDVQHICISANQIQRPDVSKVDDIYPDSGPLGAIHALLLAAKQAHCDSVMCVAVDMPLITEAELAILINRHRRTGESLHFKDNPLPCVIGVSDLHIAVAEELLRKQQNLSLRYFYEQIGCIAMSVEGVKTQLYNANTPGDWRRLPRITGVNH